MPRKETAAPNHVCPGIGIHVIDIVQPPGMDIPPAISAMDEHQRTVPAALMAKSNAETPKKARSEAARIALVVSFTTLQ
jgi:hypothetical protein